MQTSSFFIGDTIWIRFWGKPGAYISFLIVLIEAIKLTDIPKFVKKARENLRSKEKQALSQLFTAWCGEEPEHFQAFPRSGSNRTYSRIISPRYRAIGVYNPDYRENQAFLSMTRFFLSERIRVPNPLGVAHGENVYLLDDLGDFRLFDLIRQKLPYPEYRQEITSKLREVIRELARIQVMAGKRMDFSVCYPYQRFNRDSILYDLEYFRQEFLDRTGLDYAPDLLREEFQRYAALVLEADQEYFMYRDFQSRNIMLFQNTPYFIDYQGGRKGPLQYDLSAFLYQAKAGLPEEMREKLLDHYLKVLRLYTPIDEKEFKKYYHPIAMLRVLQTLGSYGFRGLGEGKEHFIESIPFALSNLKVLRKKNPILAEFPELNKIIVRLGRNKILYHGPKQ